jgi:Acyl-CoA dehydrogenase, C-terminal domain
MTAGSGLLREIGREHGLAAGLAAVLDGLDPAAYAPQGLAALPAAAVPEGQSVLPNALAAREGISLVRRPPGAQGAGPGGGLPPIRCAALAAVRIGLLDRMLALATARLAARRFGGVPLIEQQLVVGAVADVVAEIEAAAAAPYRQDTPAEATAARHERLTEAGWTVTRFFGAEGYIADHPVRCLYVSALVADVWVPRAAGREDGR